MDITGNDQEYKNDQEPSITVRSLLRAINISLTVDIRDHSKHGRSVFGKGMDEGGITTVWTILFRFNLISSDDYVNFDINRCFDDSGVN